MSKKQMLIVDDNQALCSALEAVFEDDFELSFATTGEEALAKHKKNTPQVVLMDYRMPGIDGIETLNRMHDYAPQSQVVLMSAHDDLPTVIKAMRHGATDFVGKPFELDEIKSIVAHAAATAPEPKQVQEPLISQAEVDDLIRESLQYACV